jgi:hypothetical protein
VYSQQNLFIKEVADDFRQHMNLKDALVDMLNSPWFRANHMSVAQQQIHASNKSGSGLLLSPERLDRKTKALVGKAWGEHYPEWKNYQRFTELVDNYRLTYGGIDSNGVINRAEEMTSVMSQVAIAQAAEMSCGIVLRDFIQSDNERQLFSGFTLKDVANSVASSELKMNGIYVENAQINSVNLQLPKGKTELTFSSSSNDYNDKNGVWIDINLAVFNIAIKGTSSGKIIASYSAQEIFDLNNSLNGGIETWQHPTLPVLVLYSATNFSLPIDLDVSGDYKIEINGYTDIWVDSFSSTQINAIGAKNLSISAEIENVVNNTSPIANKFRAKIADLVFDFLGEVVSPNSIIVDDLLILFEQSRKAKKQRSDWGHIQEQGSACDFLYENYTTAELDGWQKGNDPLYAMSAWRTVIFYLMSDDRYLHE